MSEQQKLRLEWEMSPRVWVVHDGIFTLIVEEPHDEQATYSAEILRQTEPTGDMVEEWKDDGFASANEALAKAERVFFEEEEGL